MHEEVTTGPRVSREELVRRLIALEPIARRASHDEVLRRVRAAEGEWIHVIERVAVVVEAGSAVHAPLTRVPERGAAHGPLHREDTRAHGARACGGWPTA